jgi:hypothetical protein
VWALLGAREVHRKVLVEKLEGESPLERPTYIHQVFLSRNANFVMQGEYVSQRVPTSTKSITFGVMFAK